MSLNYDHIFSQIDKAKKKRKRWTQADTDAYYKKQEQDKARTEVSAPSTGPTKGIDPRKRRFGVVGESATRVRGRKRGKQFDDKKESESTTRVPGRKQGWQRVSWDVSLESVRGMRERFLTAGCFSASIRHSRVHRRQDCSWHRHRGWANTSRSWQCRQNRPRQGPGRRPRSQ